VLQAGLWGAACRAAVELLGAERAFWGLGLQAAEATKAAGCYDGSNGGLGDKGEEQVKVDGGGASEQSRRTQGDSYGVGVSHAGECACREGGSAGGRDESAGGVVAPKAPRCAIGDSGDPGGVLPSPDHLRLVGVKVPAGPCMVTLTKWEEMLDDYLVV